MQLVTLHARLINGTAVPISTTTYIPCCIRLKNTVMLVNGRPKYLFVFGTTAPQWARASSFTRFLDHTHRRTTVGRTLLDEWSARRRDLYLTTHDTHNRQTSMPPVGFEPTISARERPQTHASDRAATETGAEIFNNPKYKSLSSGKPPQKQNATLVSGSWLRTQIVDATKFLSV